MSALAVVTAAGPSEDGTTVAAFSAEPQSGHGTETVYVTRTGRSITAPGAGDLAPSQIPCR